jgi:hypothetical protein
MIISDSLYEFIDHHIVKYASARNTPIHFVGSIAYYFQDELRVCLRNRSLELGNVIQEPMDELVKFHVSA